MARDDSAENLQLPALETEGNKEHQNPYNDARGPGYPSGEQRVAHVPGGLLFSYDAASRPEAQVVNPLTHPLGYFEAQVRFAQKWAELSGEDFSTLLLHKTALYKRVFQEWAPTDTVPSEWLALLETINTEAGTATVAEQLYEAYAAKPHSIYEQPKSPAAFRHEYDPDSRTVRLHFTTPIRGDNPFSEDNMPRRRDEFKQMLMEVQRLHPDAQTFLSISWIRSTRSYRNFSPPDISEQQNMMSPDMSFGDDTVWAQFVNRYGQLNRRVYDQFIRALDDATTTDELLAAFPYPVLKAEDPIEKYYEYYGLSSS